jgi:hypothetical protein
LFFMVGQRSLSLEYGLTGMLSERL